MVLEWVKKKELREGKKGRGDEVWRVLAEVNWGCLHFS